MESGIDDKIFDLILQIRNIKKEAVLKENELRKSLLDYARLVPTYSDLYSICQRFSIGMDDFCTTLGIARPIWLDAHPEFGIVSRH